MRPERSIRKTLLLGLIGGVGLLLIGAGVFTDAALERYQRDEFDDALLTKARALATLTKDLGAQLELDFADELMPEFSKATNPDYFELRDGEGRRVEISRSLGEATLPFERTANLGTRFAAARLPDGRPGRRVQLDFQIHPADSALSDQENVGLRGPAPRASVVVASGSEDLDAVLLRLRVGLLLATLFVLALAVALVHRVVRAGLQPLDELNAQLAGIDASGLSARVNLSRPTRETGEIVRQFNALLDRVQHAFERQQRFSANAAHELRTPIAEVRNLAEVAAKWSDDSALARRSLNEIAEASIQLERLVATLLAIARGERRLDVWPSEEFDLVACVQSAWTRHADAAKARRLSWRLDAPATVRVRSAREPWFRILDNLIANAVEYCPEGATIECRVGVTAQSFQLVLANPAPNLVADDLRQALEPLWRKDTARAGGQHLGLGLSLVRAYAEQLDLAVELAQEPSMWRLTLRGSLAM